MSIVERYIQNNDAVQYDKDTKMVSLPDCKDVQVPKAFLDKLFRNVRKKDVSLYSYNMIDLCQHAVQDVYNNRKKFIGKKGWSKSAKLDYRAKKTIESVDRLLMLTLSKLQPYAPNLSKSEPIKGHFDTSTQLCHEALVNLRKVLSLHIDTQKKVYSNQAKIAARDVKRLLTTLPVEVQALNRDAILYDISQLKKYHQDFKP